MIIFKVLFILVWCLCVCGGGRVHPCVKVYSLRSEDNLREFSSSTMWTIGIQTKFSGLAAMAFTH